MVNNDIWIPTPDELDAEVAAERERRGGRRSGVRAVSPETSGDAAGPQGPSTPRRTLRIASDVTRRGRTDGPEADGAR
jgi:hypothetical protein